jgi:hypothetical protein
MKKLRRDLVAAALLLGSLISLPALAQIQYFGYVGGADNDSALAETRGFTNFAQISTESDLAGTFIRSRLTAMTPYGIKAMIDLGLVLWCDYSNDQHYVLCNNFEQRLSTWHQNNTDVLTPDRVLAFSVRDEPFRHDVDMATYDYLAHLVKSHFPWAKIYLTESSPCGIQGSCGPGDNPTAYANYHGTLPDVDWIGLDHYLIWPRTDSTFQSMRATFKSRFPGKKWIYVMDGYWDLDHYREIGPPSSMAQVARDWYDVARADPDAILLGVFIWSRLGGSTTSTDFGCDVLAEHVAIGKAITGKGRSQTSSATGFLYGIDSNGVATGWACDPDALLCERPRLDYYVNGIYGGQVSYPNDASARIFGYCAALSGPNTLGYIFRQNLPYSTIGAPITIYAHDLDSAATSLLPTWWCAGNPACIWYTNFYPPKGYIDFISWSGIATGWVCDPDAPLVSTTVRFASGAANIGTYTTTLSNEPAVSNECGGGTLHRFSVQLPAWTSGKGIHAFAEDLMSGEVQIPSLCGDGWTCGWGGY